MLSLFEFAIGVGLLVFIVLVACVYGGMLCLYIWDTAKKIPLEACFRDSVFVFPSPCDLCGLVCILLWLEYLSAEAGTKVLASQLSLDCRARRSG